MKRLSVLFCALLAAALLMPTIGVATEPVVLSPWESPDPVPAGVPLMIPAGWISVSRGLAMQAPKYNDFYFTIWDSAGNVVHEVTLEESDDYWTELTDMGADAAGPAFNPRIRASQFYYRWQYDIPEGLAAGEYRMVAGFEQTKTMFDLYWYYDGQHSPMKLEPGGMELYDWTFTVE